MSPFQSKAQRKYMFMKHPKIAKKWADETWNNHLPEHVELRKTKARQRARDRKGR